MPTNKDAWDKLDILMKPLGGIIAGVAVATIGYLGTQFLRDKEVIDANSRVFAQIISQREGADSDLRMNMFRSIIEKFFNNPSDRGQQVLSLELLAYNFHEALDLAPLFQRVNTDLRNDVKVLRASATPGQSSPDLQNTEDLMSRLERVAKEVNLKQAAALAEDGFSAQGTVFLDELKGSPQGVTVIDKQQLGDRWFKVEVLASFPDDKELRIKLTVYTKATNTGEAIVGSWNISDTMFNVGFFDYPMIDNTRLSNGKRAAVILQDWYSDVHSAEIQLIYFPGSRSSLKDKQYYDELLSDLLKLNTMRGVVR
jgi:hypothetical protein